MSNGLVSVIIPTYNRGSIISKCIESVLAQTYQNIEIIVVDDGSTDDTGAKLREYGSRIRIVTQTNAGPAVARNRGIEVSRGQIIAFQDSDDLWKPAKLQRQVSLLDKLGKSVPCCLCNAIMRNIYGDGNEHLSFDISSMQPGYDEGLWLNVPEVLATRFVLFNQTVAIRRDAIEKVGGFDPDLKYMDDYDLPLRLSLEGPWAYIREPLTIWAGGASDSFAQKATRDAIILKECEIKIAGRVLDRVRASGGNPSLQRHLERRIKGYRRGLRTINLHRSRSPLKRVLGKLVGTYDRYYGAAFRRSPWFPKMDTVSIEDWKSHNLANFA
jgi:glycosyltransferase involved in cell wall biosynthesis